MQLNIDGMPNIVPKSKLSIGAVYYTSGCELLLYLGVEIKDNKNLYTFYRLGVFDASNLPSPHICREHIMRQILPLQCDLIMQEPLDIGYIRQFQSPPQIIAIMNERHYGSIIKSWYGKSAFLSNKDLPVLNDAPASSSKLNLVSSSSLREFGCYTVVNNVTRYYMYLGRTNKSNSFLWLKLRSYDLDNIKAHGFKIWFYNYALPNRYVSCFEITKSMKKLIPCNEFANESYFSADMLDTINKVKVTEDVFAR